MDAFSADGYLVARELLQRGVGVVYLLAFVAVIDQWRPLLGSHGLTPVPTFLERAPWKRTPSLFHLRYTDRLAATLAWVGIALATAVVAGIPQRLGTGPTMLVLGVLWVLYLSYVNVGQIWFAFGWESILLEAGFLAIFLGGHDMPVPWPTLLLVRWLLFRVEFGAGLIKLRGDPCWRNLTCLDYHHETQPLPNGLSRSFHHLPGPLHKAEVGANHVTQLVLPFLLFLPQPWAGIAAVAVVATQGWLMLSGNFAWLNLVTIVLATSALPDAWIGGAADLLMAAVPPAEPAAWVTAVVIAVFVAQIALSWWPVRNLMSRRQLMNASYNPFHLVGSYGAFGSITRRRHEIVVEGTTDPDPGPDSVWHAYEFRAKPTDPQRRPPQVAPYHLRLDWLLWFAAMSPSPASPHSWFTRLLAGLLDADPQLLRLLRRDPFRGAAPTAVRARRYVYRFTVRGRPRSAAWWDRHLVDDDTSIVRRRTPAPDDV